MLSKRDWKLYSDIRHGILKHVRDYLSTGGIDRSNYLRGLDVDMSEGAGYLVAKIGEICLAENVKDEVLTFEYDTSSQGIQHLHLMKVHDVNNNRTILLHQKKWLINNEVKVFVKLTHAFLQGLSNYSITQFAFEDLAKHFGIETRQLPEGFGIDLETWEKGHNVPSLGTKDVLGSYMEHVYSGRLKLDGKSILD